MDLKSPSRAVTAGIAVAACAALPSTVVAAPITVVQAVPAGRAALRIDGRAIVVVRGVAVRRLDVRAGWHRLTYPHAVPGAPGDVYVTADEGVSLVWYLRPDGSVGVKTYSDLGLAVRPGQTTLVLRGVADAPAVDVRVDGRDVFSGVTGGQGIARVPAGRHRLGLVAHDTRQPLAGVGDVKVALPAGRTRILYLAGSERAGTLRFISTSAAVRGARQRAQPTEEPVTRLYPLAPTASAAAPAPAPPPPPTTGIATTPTAPAATSAPTVAAPATAVHADHGIPRALIAAGAAVALVLVALVLVLLRRRRVARGRARRGLVAAEHAPLPRAPVPPEPAAVPPSTVTVRRRARDDPETRFLNAATAGELAALPGIGRAMARRIVDFRAERGELRSLNELREVPGIGDARIAALREALRTRGGANAGR
jgi:competence protein ComEA